MKGKLIRGLSLVILSIFLINTTSAMLVFGGFNENWEPNAQINDGQSIDLNVYFTAGKAPMNINIQLEDSAGNSIYILSPTNINEMYYYQTFNIDKNIYKTSGSFKIILSGSDSIPSSNSNFDNPLTLTINPVEELDPDTTAPVITLLGSLSVNVEVGASYTDAGATASDNIDGDITSQITIVNPVNTNVLGTYIITYNVQDSAGNSATQKTRTVNVVDTTSPIITLVGSNPQNIQKGHSYVEQGANATDSYDGDLTDSIVIDSSAVDTSTTGLYVVTYEVSDSSGNSATTMRLVNVVEDEDEDEGDDDEEDKKKKKRTKSHFKNDRFYEHLYFNQFQPITIEEARKISGLSESEEKQLCWFQKFINWLKKLFGFK